MDNTNYMDLWEQRMNRDTLSEEEQLRILRSLGIVIPEDAAQECNTEDEFTSVLAAIGWGDYDYDKRLWTPSSQQIYAFDAEAFDIEAMYPNYLKGLQAISKEELSFTNIVQDNSKVHWEEPSGTVSVRFQINGMDCSYDADFQGDWLDCRILAVVNHCLEKLGVDKRFYSTDIDQRVIIFFCTEQWARQFERATLCFMSSSGTH